MWCFETPSVHLLCDRETMLKALQCYLNNKVSILENRKIFDSFDWIIFKLIIQKGF